VRERVWEKQREGKAIFQWLSSSLQTFPALATENNPQESGPTWTKRVDCNPLTHMDHTDQTDIADTFKYINM